jgi:hypothetical protein
MAGKFVLTKNSKGQFHWNLNAGNGETNCPFRRPMSMIQAA